MINIPIIEGNNDKLKGKSGQIRSVSQIVNNKTCIYISTYINCIHEFIPKFRIPGFWQQA
jgi:hypothetical protein